MAQIPLTINNGTAPYTITVIKSGESTNRFTSFTGGILRFTALADGINNTYNVHIVDSTGCISDGSFNFTCGGSQPLPDYTYTLLQPYCSVGDNVVQPATLNLTNIVNTIRYKICYNSSTFTSGCNSSCTTSDGTITGTTASISLTAPTQGNSYPVTIRFLATSGCDTYSDLVLNLSTPNCNDASVVFVDLQTNATDSFGKICDNPSTYPVTYDFYFTPNTTGLETINGLQSIVGTSSNRNLPNGNEVPDVYISAAFKPSCGGGASAGLAINTIFYRFVFNFSKLKADFPSVTSYTFDLYSNRTKNTATGGSPNSIFVTKSAFPGVRMVKELQSNNSVDAYRFPSKTAATTTHTVVYNSAVSGFRKVATMTYVYSTNTLTFTPIA